MSARLVELVTHREPDLTSPRSLEIQREAFVRHGLVVVPTRGRRAACRGWCRSPSRRGPG
jgi:hypothetical protein